MATYAMGDIQGCYDTLQKLLHHIGFNATSDRVWLVGDLVNRGPKSLEVLRWARALGDRATCVLGNHDLHLLATAAGARKSKRDTFAKVLDALDCDELLQWLRFQPLVHQQGNHLMVHAGLHPAWNFAQSNTLAREVEDVLRSDHWAKKIGAITRPPPPVWTDQLTGDARLRAIAAVLVRIRTCTASGAINNDFAGPPRDAPPGYLPWFEVPERRSQQGFIIFGHWSALGLQITKQYAALDTGCVWGNQLTALRLDDQRVFQVDAVDG